MTELLKDLRRQPQKQACDFGRLTLRRQFETGRYEIGRTRAMSLPKILGDDGDQFTDPVKKKE
jgi:hypothetical protein